MALDKNATPEDVIAVREKLTRLKNLANTGKLRVDMHISLHNDDAFVFHFINEVRDTDDIMSKHLPAHLMNLGMMLEMNRLQKKMAKNIFGSNMEGLF